MGMQIYWARKQNYWEEMQKCCQKKNIYQCDPSWEKRNSVCFFKEMNCSGINKCVYIMTACRGNQGVLLLL